MDRADFLKLIGLGAAVKAAEKLQNVLPTEPPPALLKPKVRLDGPPDGRVFSVSTTNNFFTYPESSIRVSSRELQKEWATLKLR